MTEQTNAEWLRERASGLRARANPCAGDTILITLAARYDSIADEIERLQAMITKDLGS